MSLLSRCSFWLILAEWLAALVAVWAVWSIPSLNGNDAILFALAGAGLVNALAILFGAGVALFCEDDTATSKMINLVVLLATASLAALLAILGFLLHAGYLTSFFLIMTFGLVVVTAKIARHYAGMISSSWYCIPFAIPFVGFMIGSLTSSITARRVWGKRKFPSP